MFEIFDCLIQWEMNEWLNNYFIFFHILYVFFFLIMSTLGPSQFLCHFSPWWAYSILHACTLKSRIEVYVPLINFWLLFRPVRAYSILYVYYFFILFPTCTKCFKHFQTCTISICKHCVWKHCVCKMRSWKTFSMKGHFPHNLVFFFFKKESVW